jgi:PleD family two-component response regulator
MILAAVDDLMFASKIRATAASLGVQVTFARTAADVMEKTKSLTPSLVIFDLNSRRLDPIGTIGSLKADADVRVVKTIGFVSHVDTDTVRAAREAGVDEVLARSAFTKNLGEILERAGRSDGATVPD